MSAATHAVAPLRVLGFAGDIADGKRLGKPVRQHSSGRQFSGCCGVPHVVLWRYSMPKQAKAVATNSTASLAHTSAAELGLHVHIGARMLFGQAAGH